MSRLGKPRKHDYDDIARFWRERSEDGLTREAFVDAYYQASGNQVPVESLAYMLRTYPALFARADSDG